MGTISICCIQTEEGRRQRPRVSRTTTVLANIYTASHTTALLRSKAARRMVEVVLYTLHSNDMYVIIAAYKSIFVANTSTKTWHCAKIFSMCLIREDVKDCVA